MVIGNIQFMYKCTIGRSIPQEDSSNTFLISYVVWVTSIAPSTVPEPGINNVVIYGAEGIGKADFTFHVKTGL